MVRMKTVIKFCVLTSIEAWHKVLTLEPFGIAEGHM